MSFPHLAALLPGMIVRVPMDIERDDEEFREFRIGRIEEIEAEAEQATVALQIVGLDDASKLHIVTSHIERPLRYLRRCRILPDSPCTQVSSGAQGRVLSICDTTLPKGRHAEYLVLIRGRTQRLSEADILITSNRQDVEPQEQAAAYEFQNPVWRHPRDLLVERYTELRNATFGVEDLVGSRVFLLAHQAEVISRVLSSPECRFMLADEVGLGKTIEACVIFKALRRRHAQLKVLIIAPASLTHQWHNELNRRFWLDFPVAQPGERTYLDGPGVIVSSDDLASYEPFWQGLQQREWGLLIIDEAHNARKNPHLYERLQQLSMICQRVLVLTATPIQRRADEYLALLKLLDPKRYERENQTTFGRILKAQETIRRATVLLRPLLDPTTFDWDEAIEEVEPLHELLNDDAGLDDLVGRLRAQEDTPDEALETTRQIMAYVSENYRIEQRMIRNRRAGIGISLPQRMLDERYAYLPDTHERECLEALYEYAQDYLDQVEHTPLALEYIRVLLHAAASSSFALIDLLHQRISALRHPLPVAEPTKSMVSMAPPRQEQTRIQDLMRFAPRMSQEQMRLQGLSRQVEFWCEHASTTLQHFRRIDMRRPIMDRIIRCIQVVVTTLEDHPQRKILIFSGWPQTIAKLVPCLQQLLGREAIAQFTADKTDDALQDAADQFQSNENCRVLVCDELGGEGRNFQMADLIVHVDLPWTPAQIEQRIGRVDRLGRQGEVVSVLCIAQQTLEQDLFRIWNEAFALFTHSMSGMEIVLEETQDELMRGLAARVRSGLANLLEPLRRQSKQLRDAVEEERYFEEGAVHHRFRRQFEQISERYRDGTLIGAAIYDWSRIAGLRGSEDRYDNIAKFYPRSFSPAAIERAKFVPPNMEEALRRSGRQRHLVITGTFNRDIAVQREDLVFFAPGDDPWTDSIIANALEGDRGRCCAIHRFVSDVQAVGNLFELFFTIQVDPRPLYETNLDPVYLLQAQGFLTLSSVRVVIAMPDGEVLQHNDPRIQAIEHRFGKQRDTHLGQRSGKIAPIQQFKAEYPSDIWRTMIQLAIVASRKYLDRELAFTKELAKEARAEFEQRMYGWEAALSWRKRYGVVDNNDEIELTEYRKAAAALVKGIQHPVRRLESLCFWQLRLRESE